MTVIENVNPKDIMRSRIESLNASGGIKLPKLDVNNPAFDETLTDICEVFQMASDLAWALGFDMFLVSYR